MNNISAKEFIYKNARPIDMMRWKYHFEGEKAENFLSILEAYQNPDGGFGHALEADCWNPNSSPIQTWSAIEILKELNYPKIALPMIKKILIFLEKTVYFDGTFWSNTIPTNNDYPHAPWWGYDINQAQSYNPTVSLIGFYLKFGDQNHEFYKKMIELAKYAIQYLKDNLPIESMHTVSCYVELYEDLKDENVIELEELGKLLENQIKYSINTDVSIWDKSYVCKPSLFIKSKTSPFYEKYKDICEAECSFLENTQQADGTWTVTWNWDSYFAEWEISKNWWKADIIIKNLLFYKNIKKGI